MQERESSSHAIDRLSEPVVTPQTSPVTDHALVEAINHHHAGRAAEAERLFRAILASPADHAVASYGLGILLAAQGRPQDAVDAYRHAIAVRPDFVDAYINLGTVLLGLGQHEEAVALYRHAIAASPENGMAHGNLGKALLDLGRIDEAIAACRAGIACQPDNAFIHCNLGAALLEQHAWEDAVTATRRAINLAPASAIAHANLGTALLKLGRYDDALATCRRAIELHPEGVAFHASLGGAMLELGALQEAATLCRRAIDLDPLQPSAHFNLSHALKGMNQLEEAEYAARQAVSRQPDSAEYHFHLAHVLLLRGNLEAGWSEFDWRLMMPDFAWIGDLFGVSAKPRWYGEDIADKTILIFTEQGLGDIIQFARYLPLVRRRAARVIVATHSTTRRLLETIDGIVVIPIEAAPFQAHDVQCPLLSLPRAFATRLDSIPAQVPYFRIGSLARARWDRRVGAHGLRVGIVWAGNPATRRDRFRSPGLASVMPLFAVPNVDFVVLQVGAGREHHGAACLPPHVLDLGQEVTDLADTAAIMAGLDLMISSCTGPLHLAGALGVPTWAMIPFAPHFPWLLGRSDTLWYPSMRLYRQAQPGQDWSGVVRRIAVDLAALSQARSSRSPPVSAPAARFQSAREPLPPNRDEMTSREADSMHDANVAPRRPMPNPKRNGLNEFVSCRRGTMLCSRHDIKTGASLRKYGEFCHGETALFEIIVQPRMTVLDIGANIGVHTVDLSHMVGEEGEVHAFEPQRLLFQLLCANVALNNCTNVFTHHAAAGAISGTVLVPSPELDRRDIPAGRSRAGPPAGELVTLMTIDSLDLRACHVIRLNVNGMEAEALRGAAATIARCRPILYLGNDREDRSAELIRLVQSHGYRLYWYLPRLYNENNFRADTENIFGDAMLVNMLCVPTEVPQSSLSVMREVIDPSDRWHQPKPDEPEPKRPRQHR